MEEKLIDLNEVLCEIIKKFRKIWGNIVFILKQFQETR